jgi:glycosyltransferase involved in cell wall biosynthesis
MTLEPMALCQLPESPLVSIIISNYNYGHFLDGCIGSVKRQSYRHIEVIVCDDGSSDDSVEILEKLESMVPNLTVISKRNGGQATAWNTAVAAARGDILAFLDPDDRFLEGKVARVVDAFRSDPQAGVCIHRWLPVLGGSRVVATPFPVRIDHGWLAERAFRRGASGQWPPTSGMAIRREVAERIFPIPALHRLCWSDAYVLSLAQFMTIFSAIEEPLMLYLIHGSNSVATAKVSEISVIEMLRSYEEVFRGAKSWLSESFGPGLAAELDIFDNVNYVEHLLALRLLAAQAPLARPHHLTRTLLARLPQSRRRWIWLALLRLPRPAARWLLRQWWSIAPWKRWARLASGTLGVRLSAPPVEPVR